jgi:hypothetical protein
MALVKDFLKGTRIENSKWYRNSVRNRIPLALRVDWSRWLRLWWMKSRDRIYIAQLLLCWFPPPKSVYAYVFFFLSLIHFCPLILVQIRSLVENFLLFLEPKSKKMSELDFTWLLKFSSSTSRESAHRHTRTRRISFLIWDIFWRLLLCVCVPSFWPIGFVVFGWNPLTTWEPQEWLVFKYSVRPTQFSLSLLFLHLPIFFFWGGGDFEKRSIDRLVWASLLPSLYLPHLRANYVWPLIHF